ncbi:hypothetical protein J514_4279, partial [Acinetobacter sp. 1396970]
MLSLELFEPICNSLQAASTAPPTSNLRRFSAVLFFLASFFW